LTLKTQENDANVIATGKQPLRQCMAPSLPVVHY